VADTIYYRPIAHLGAPTTGALPLAGGPCWFEAVAQIRRGGHSTIVANDTLPDDVRAALTTPRAPICGLSLDQPRLMGILNVTPDSFSDGGLFCAHDDALAQATAMLAGGADILDIGGESTRPGAELVDVATEITRTEPLIQSLRAAGLSTPISIDTRKSAVARRALAAGAVLINDVSALQYDPEMLDLVRQSGAPVCLMHAQGSPKTMQADPHYNDVLLDVYDDLAARVAVCVSNGIPRSRIIVDPGIGFGKTLAHNLALIRGISLFHGLGCAVLLGASRKKFIGTIGSEANAARRAPGSITVALHAAQQGVQILRVHDIGETKQAILLWRALNFPQ